MEIPLGFRLVAEPTAFEEAIADAVRAIPRGRVASYSAIAVVAGRPGTQRAVGAALARGLDVPAHRVVTAAGRLVPGWEDEQRARLREEGVRVAGGHVAEPIPWWP